MKPFNLEAAKAGQPVVTRDGRPARYLGEVNYPDTPYVFAVPTALYDDVIKYSDVGKLDRFMNALDLFMAPVKKSGWINLYGVGAKYPAITHIKPTREAAVTVAERAKLKLVATLPIEWEE